ncbi:Pre-mRNA-splicing helicase BRR2 [Entomophthora muscae]|uniref:Pre-mRNA-splicing helicase BRR2 n=1 Tax=Entomophthora muscae TaxID=34485 RepID=A0ACC2UMV8_9FUNG|nr:Pre-mRNA-splicing helicase BRR2 [Entomophthora muscae]
MAEEHAKNSQYQYVGNSNLVIQSKRSGPRDNEPTGEPDSLAGRINPADFGARAIREKPKEIERQRQPAKKGKHGGEKKKGSARDISGQGYGHTSVLGATDDFETLNYRPKTKETRAAYEMMLSLVQRQLGDQSQEVVRSATDAVLEILKTDTMKDLDKLNYIKITLTSLTQDQFGQLVSLSKKLTDYIAEGDTTKDDVMDGELGVAVIFDEDDDDGRDEFGLKEDSDEEEEEEEEDKAMEDDMFNPEAVTDLPQELTDNIEVIASRTKELSVKDQVMPYDVDAFWLQRLVKTYFPDERIATEKTERAMQLLAADTPLRDCENELMELTGYSHFELVSTLIKNRDVIVWCTRLARAGKDTQERINTEREMESLGLGHILRALATDRNRPHQSAGDASNAAPEAATSTAGIAPKQNIDLDQLVFTQGAHLMSNKTCKLPAGSYKRTYKGYDEFHVLAPQVKPMEVGERLVPIKELPAWCQPAFASSQQLNRIQSRVYPCAFKNDGNMLLCAPTGAGKTNCAMLCILREIGKYYNEETKTVDLDAFKLVYIAPMKALVQEMVGGFSERLKFLGITVAELTGDSQLTKQQISETQILVTTPEKWDIITRKATDRSYTNLVRLVIMDEIHLLHDDRGPILESIVARALRHSEETQEPIRLVGLSATLPNFNDVATFLRVDPKSGLFEFDSSFRPCPLRQQFIGITEKKAIKRFQAMNEVCYTKVMDQAGKNQTLVFVHSRKETARTAQALRDMAVEAGTITEFLPESSSKEILENDADAIKDAALKDLLPYGFAIHHAGMARADRTAVEDLFREGHIQVLVSTATLAWGVNLPAHTVIIKGTQIYSPEKGCWTELSPQDVLQMLGRAGRPQYDTFGEGIIITTHGELQYYLSLLNAQLPIESQFVSRLSDNLNAEIVLGTVRSRDDAVEWLGYTYLYVRMMRNSPLYGISEAELNEDPLLRQKRVDLIHAAASVLDSCQMLKYDRRTGRFQGTELGRIAAHYYISHRSMATYNQHLRPSMSYIELFRAFAMSDEFRYIPVREEEKLEVAKLLERVPIPVKEGPEEPAAKINVLLQAYISQLGLEGFALMSDMVYVTQSASRILRAMFEMCLRRGWSSLARAALDLCKIVDRRCWLSMTPLRQFRTIPPDLIKRIDAKKYPWDRYLDLDAHQLGELVGKPSAGNLIHKFVHMLPHLDITAQVQPITRSLLRIELTISPDFVWDTRFHGSAEVFWVLVEDADGDNILYHESFVLKQRYIKEEHYLAFTVPLHEPTPPNYFVSVVSDRWLHSETRQAVVFHHMILPDRYPPHTELYDMQPLPVEALQDPAHQSLYRGWVAHFNPIQTQVFNTFYGSDDNVFLGAPSGSGKTMCAEFAILRLWARGESRCLYLAPCQEVVDEMVEQWKVRFAPLGKDVLALTGETSADLRLLDRADLVLATPTQWDVISRNWRKRRNVQELGLIIADDIHMVGGVAGPTYEVVVSRMRYIVSQTGFSTRTIALSAPLANARDVAVWIGAPTSATFNFHPADRPVPLEVHIQSFAIPHFPSRMLAMAKPTFNAINSYAATSSTIVYVPSRRQCRLTAAELTTLQAASVTPTAFLGCQPDQIAKAASQVSDASLAQLLPSGIGFFHEALSEEDKLIIERLFQAGAIRVLVASRDSCWGMGKFNCQLVVIMGAQFFEGKEHRYVDYPVADMLKMLGRASSPLDGATGRCVLMCQPNKKEYYKKFLNEGLPIESHLDHELHDCFNAAIVTRTIENKQDAVDFLTWTFLYRRLAKNPNYYNLQGTTHQHLSDHLTELVESTMTRLADTLCIHVENEIEVSSLNLGMIAAYYNIHYDTLDLLSHSLTSRTKLRGLLEIVAAANEFSQLPIRHHEEALLLKLYAQLPVRLAEANMRTPAVKTHLLLQAHFARTSLPPDLTADQAWVLRRIIPLLQATVDVASSKGWLQPALAAMELAQMCVQAQWDRDSPLKQLPYFDAARIQLAQSEGIESVIDFMECEESSRQKVLDKLNPRQIHDIAAVVNRYPSLALQHEIATDPENLKERAPFRINISVEREDDEEDISDKAIDIKVNAPFFPCAKDEAWWVVVGEPSANQLLAIKRFTVAAPSLQLALEFPAPRPAGKHALKLYLMADSYLGCDQEYDIDVEILEGLPSDAEDEEEDEDDD